MKHVLVIPSWYPTPEKPQNGEFFRVQVNALKEKGFKVGVICPEPRSLREYSLTSSQKTLYRYDSGVPTYINRKWGFFFKMLGLNALLAEVYLLEMYEKYTLKHGEPDIIHIHSAIFTTGVTKLKTKAKIVVTEHSSTFGRGMLSLIHKKRISSLLLKAQVLTAVSNCLIETLVACFPETKGQWSKLPNMVPSHFEDINIDNLKSNKNSEGFVFFNLGFFSKNKGQAKVIRAFSLIGCENATLVIGGDGLIRNELEALTRELGISERVIFKGLLTREEVLSEMLTCDAFVLGSEIETFGVVLLEAFACGKPVISTKCGGPEEFVNDSNGLLADKKAESLSVAMKCIIEKASQYSSEKIRNDCISKYSKDAVIRKLITFL